MGQLRGTANKEIGQSVRHLESLVNDLCTAGWQATLVIPNGEWPRVHVVNPYMRALNEDVIAAPDATGTWWFWWSWMERIGGVTDITQVLARVGQVLVVNGER